MNRHDSDLSEELRQRVLDACAAGQALGIIGGGSKSFYGRRVSTAPLNLSGHRGMLSHEPTELVFTARAGTPLTEIEAALAEHGQMLPFEPPHYGPDATLGGAVASGLSGPRRPYTGAVRDFVLGCKLLNGKGEILSFGGRVMKNVAGFDVSRLMAGALGTLGVLLEVSMKVLPKPECEATFTFDLTAEAGLEALNRWALQSWPLSAACHDGRRWYVRFSGADCTIQAAQHRLGGEPLADAERFWADLREQRLGFFAGEGNLWRLSLVPASPMPNLPGVWFTDWGGALRWLKTEAPVESVFLAARSLGGHATLFRAHDPTNQVFQPLPPSLKALHLNLKRAFDPKGIFNPGRMYEEW
jgi:glycolate oxidase FAD binding subunit